MEKSSTRVFTSIFEGDKLKEGVYMIQNLHTESYLDVRLRSMELCCRPVNDLEAGRGLWEIRKFGDGYTISRVDPANPNRFQFCSPMVGTAYGEPLGVIQYPVGWRVERAREEIYRQFEHVRFFFGTTDRTWDLWGGNKENDTSVNFCSLNPNVWQVWVLIPVGPGGVQEALKSEA